MNAFFETTNGFNFQIIDPLIESRGVRLTWFDCKKVTDCNKVIKSFCNQNGWGFIKHPNIDETCVNNQKLHLNKKGIAILASNLVNHIVH